MLEQAIDLANRGFAVFPLKPGTKRPMFNRWEKLASAEPGQITRWWNATPRANIAIACGPSNLLVIDLDKAKRPDGPRHGQESLAKLATDRELPRTFTVASARGGRHLYFRQPADLTLTNTVGSESAGLGPLVDTRGHGGFIVAPGSVFEGGTYRIERENEIATLPGWIVDELTNRRPAAGPTPASSHPREPITDRRRSAYISVALGRSAAAVAAAPEGTRNHTLNREAFRLGRLVGGGVLDRGDAEVELHRAAHRAGLPSGEAASTIASGISAGTAHPRSIPDRTPTSRPTRFIEEATMTTVAEQAGAQEDHEDTASEATSDNARLGAGDQSPTEVFGSGFEDIWNDVRIAIERARLALPDWTELSTIDDLRPAVKEVLRYRDQAAAAGATPAASGPANPAAGLVDPSADTIELAAASSGTDVDDQMAAMDRAYAAAQASGIPAEGPEWERMTAIHGAIHNLWDTIKAATGSYWMELSADVRLKGLVATLAIRAAHSIAEIATAAASHLEQHGRQDGPGVARVDKPNLREAYLNARIQVHSHAATHEWQRITALWGTVNTLTRHADDPGIRAVVARSSEALSGYAQVLDRKIGNLGSDDTIGALASLSDTARRYAAALSDIDGHGAPEAPRVPDAELLQATARRVAQHAQSRLAQATAKPVVGPRGNHLPNTPPDRNRPPRLATRNSRQEPTIAPLV